MAKRPVLALFMALLPARALHWPDFAQTERHQTEIARLAALIPANVDKGCLQMFDGPPVLDYLSRGCSVSRFVFPDHLSAALEANAIGSIHPPNCVACWHGGRKRSPSPRPISASPTWQPSRSCARRWPGIMFSPGVPLLTAATSTCSCGDAKRSVNLVSLGTEFASEDIGNIRRDGGEYLCAVQ